MAIRRSSAVSAAILKAPKLAHPLTLCHTLYHTHQPPRRHQANDAAAIDIDVDIDITLTAACSRAHLSDLQPPTTNRSPRWTPPAP